MRDVFERLLVSSPNGGGLLVVNKRVVHKLDSFDTTAISWMPGLFLRSEQKQPQRLWICTAQRALELGHDTVPFDDIHDVLCSGEHIYLAATGNNEIIKLDKTGCQLQRWVFPGQQDSRHINCLAIWKERIVYSAFGDFLETRGYKGRTFNAGYVQDLISGERLINGLSQPHSLVVNGDNLLIANSEEKELLEFSPSGELIRKKKLGGYTRGICISDGVIFVGLSRSRNVDEPGVTTAEIVALNVKSWKELGRVSLPVNEIYSVLRIEEPSELISILAQIAGHTSSKYGETLAERENQITALRQGLAELHSTVEAQQQTLVERDGHIVNLKQAVDERHGQIASLNQAVAERDGQIASLNQAVAERDGQIASLNQAVAERDGQIASLNQAVAERDGQIASLNQAVAERNGQVVHLKEVELHRDALLASTSWRLTKPLRIVGLQLKRAGHVWRLLPRILRIAGELRGTSVKAFRVMCREAFAGVKWRIAYAATGKSPLRRSPAPSTDSPSSQSYDEWIRRYDTLTEVTRTEMRQRTEAFATKPLISVVMPTYNANSEWLEKSIESVRRQIYPYWELCIADDASTDPRIRPLLERHAREDQRIKAVFRQKNQLVSTASNSAVELAAGEYIALLDHDDLLRDHALFWVANEINDHPEVDLIYSDEDKIDVDGRRFDPNFKPDWNPALILSQNFFCHVGVYRRDLVTRVGGFRVGFEGSQDHDLVLRCADATNADRIRHIPRILYHLRSVPSSTALANPFDAKPYAWHAGVRAIEDHMRRRKIEGRVVPVLSQGYQVDYPLTDVPPKVSIVIPTTCKPHLLRPCMEALLERTTYPDFEVLLAVNEISFHHDERSAYLGTMSRAPRVRILVYENRPFSYSWTNNWAIKQATGSVLCLMNDDVMIITPDWLEKLVARLQLDHVGAVGPMLYYPDNRIQHAGVTLGINGVAGHTYIGLPRGTPGYFGRAALEQDLSCVTAACMVLRREAFEQVNGFNEELAVAFNDVDLCIRLRNAGWRIIWTPQVEHYHHESASFGRHDSPQLAGQFKKEVALMRKLWGPKLDADPFHNPNLSLYDYNISLAFPPRVPQCRERTSSRSQQ